MHKKIWKNVSTAKVNQYFSSFYGPDIQYNFKWFAKGELKLLSGNQMMDFLKILTGELKLQVKWWTFSKFLLVNSNFRSNA